MFVEIVCTIFFLLGLSKVALRDRLSFSVIAAYIVWYGFWLSVSTFNFYELDEVGEQAYIYQMFGVAMTVLGYLWPVSGIVKSPQLKHGIVDLSFERSGVFVSLIIGLTVWAFVVFIAYQAIVASQRYDSRMVFFENKDLIFGHLYLGYLWNWIVGSIFNFVLVLLSLRILRFQLFSFQSFLYGIFIFLYGTVGAGRILYIQFFLSIAVCWLVGGYADCVSSNAIDKKVSRAKQYGTAIALGTFLVAAVLVMGYLTSLRDGDSRVDVDNVLQGVEQFSEQIVVYNTGSFRAFSYGIENGYLDRIGPLFGRGAFAAVEDLLSTFFAAFGWKPFETSNDILSKWLQDVQIEIGVDKYFNYAYTQSFIFYMDFGFFGIVLFSFLFGWMFRRVVNNFLISPNFYSFFLLVFLTLALFNSNFSYKLQSLGSLVTIGGALILDLLWKRNSRMMSFRLKGEQR